MGGLAPAHPETVSCSSAITPASTELEQYALPSAVSVSDTAALPALLLLRSDTLVYLAAAPGSCVHKQQGWGATHALL